MRLILNGINHEYLRNITENNREKTERVDAAVAYVSSEDLLFNWCWENKIPLKFWGRHDETVPVEPYILKKFLDRRSANYRCKLVRHFHAKVIWWHGVGAYVGSANLSDSAWNGNVEAGTFFEESELEELGMDEQLKDFFNVLENHGSELTEEIWRFLEDRKKQLSQDWLTNKKRSEAARENPIVSHWPGLVTVPRRNAADRQKAEFLNEWNSTLTVLRNLAAKVTDYRPDWVKPDAPAGAQVDRFLAAHYYKRVMENGRSLFEDWHQKTKLDPDKAELEALEWWRSHKTPPSNEEKTLNEWAPFLREKLSAEGLQIQSAEALGDIFLRVHAIRDHSLKIENSYLGLSANQNHTLETKCERFAIKIFDYRSEGGKNIFDLLNYIIYGGLEEDIPMRLWDGISNKNWRFPHIGRNSLGEIVGWALPDKYPPRNGRTSKALRSLGHNVRV